ncbi:MAG: DUF3276 family protein [Bacteroidaceae bacterium]|nr:DUF3276 family protein [Bacteroidaceae bacterium]
METDKKPIGAQEAEILFSRTVKAGQRIYYIDVKQNRRGEMYLSITESKKMNSGTPEMPQVSFEKHKIFLFREDFGKFTEALGEALNFVNSEQGEPEERKAPESADPINIDLEF